METDEAGTAFFLFPFQTGINRIRRRGKQVIQIGGHQDNPVRKGYRRCARRIPEETGNRRQQGGHRNSRQEFAAQQIPGGGRIDQKRTDHDRAAHRTA